MNYTRNMRAAFPPRRENFPLARENDLSRGHYARFHYRFSAAFFRPPFFRLRVSISLYFRGQVDGAAIKTSPPGRVALLMAARRTTGPLIVVYRFGMKNGFGLSPKWGIIDSGVCFSWYSVC